MDWKQFFAAVISSTAWPVAVIALVALLRDPLSKFIPLIRTLKIKDVQIDLGEQLQKVKEEVEATTDEPAPDEPGLASFKSVAEVDPRAAMLSAWIPVERELRGIAEVYDMPRHVQLWRLIDELSRMNVLDSDTTSMLQSLNRIRNDAAHLSDRDINFEEALTMAEMCRRLINKLKAAKWTAENPPGHQPNAG